MIKKKNKVLFLARWYPNRYDPMLGLFIQKHAEAASTCCDVGVVYVTKLENEKAVATYSIDNELINGVQTVRIYYSPSKIKLINIFRYFKANFIGINLVKKQLGDFNIIHIHILTRLGLIALFYKLFYNIPFIITEHWSRYLPLTDSFKGFFRKKLTQYVVKRATTVTAVTNNLANSMKAHKLFNNNYFILPNVVDSAFLKYNKITKQKDSKTVFVHVSCFEDKSKNISGLLRVISNLSKIRSDFVFKLIGDGMDMDWLRNYSGELGLTKNEVVFTGLLQGSKLVEQMASANMLVVFSNYENFPVVINESLSLGVPVIATRVGGIPERVVADVGILVDAKNENQLLAGLESVLDKKVQFDSDKIKAQAIAEFSPKNVGRILCDLYNKCD